MRTFCQLSDYGLYATSWGSSPDKVFRQQDTYQPYLGGEFVWTGFDYLGEPTPFGDYENGTLNNWPLLARSSYFGIIDLAGIPKDRFYIYQARWNPTKKMAHLLPHWSWGSDRENQTTPVHVFSSADEAELFVNGVSAGKRQKEAFFYRFRWDDVKFVPGEIKVVTWKNGTLWAEETRRTTGPAVGLKLRADRTQISADGQDLSFVTVSVVDDRGDVVPMATDEIKFEVKGGAGEIVATDNGDPIDQTVFPSLSRKAFAGKAIAIVRGFSGKSGDITVSASAGGLKGAEVTVRAG